MTSRLLTRSRVILLLVLALVWFGLNYVHTDYYSVEQGSATPIAPNLTVTGLPSDPPPSGLVAQRPGFFLVDVRLEQMTLGRWLRARLLGGIDFIPLSALVPSGTTVGDFDRSGYIDMEDAKQTASYVAFHELGLPTSRRAGGAVVVARRIGSPATKAKIRVGDRIVGMNAMRSDSSSPRDSAAISRHSPSCCRANFKRRSCGDEAVSRCSGDHRSAATHVAIRLPGRRREGAIAHWRWLG
jgi:PDZ domain-containing secreted protein